MKTPCVSLRGAFFLLTRRREKKAGRFARLFGGNAVDFYQ
jgi:hypothetical protein